VRACARACAFSLPSARKSFNTCMQYLTGHTMLIQCTDILRNKEWGQMSASSQEVNKRPQDGKPTNTSHGGAGSAGGSGSPANGSGSDGMMVKGGSQAK
jgi:hypothetical protein